MDQRKSIGVSSSTRGRGRGFLPQVSPTNQQYPQSAYYPQPSPPMNPYLQQQYYTQPPPPMNPSQYNITMTSEFDQFIDYREGPSRREPSVERELLYMVTMTIMLSLFSKRNHKLKSVLIFNFIHYNFNCYNFIRYNFIC